MNALGQSVAYQFPIWVVRTVGRLVEPFKDFDYLIVVKVCECMCVFVMEVLENNTLIIKTIHWMKFYANFFINYFRRLCKQCSWLYQMSSVTEKSYFFILIGHNNCTIGHSFSVLFRIWREFEGVTWNLFLLFLHKQFLILFNTFVTVEWNIMSYRK